MNQSSRSNPWEEINGGLRGSTLLRAGAILSLPAALLNFAYSFLPSQGLALGDWAVTSAWLVWIVALLFMAGGFLWVGIQPFLGRFGWVVGGFFFLNALYLVLVLFARYPLPVPGASIVMGRTLVLLFFAVLESNNLSRKYSLGLIVIAFLQLAKITLRLLELWPAIAPGLDQGIDAGILILMSLALFFVGGVIRRAENSWAREIASQRAGCFADFNNPEHDWNKND